MWSINEYRVCAGSEVTAANIKDHVKHVEFHVTGDAAGDHFDGIAVLVNGSLGMLEDLPASK